MERTNARREWFEVNVSDARSQRAWTDKPVREATLRQLYDLCHFRPHECELSANEVESLHDQHRRKRKTETMLRLQ